MLIDTETFGWWKIPDISLRKLLLQIFVDMIMFGSGLWTRILIPVGIIGWIIIVGDWFNRFIGMIDTIGGGETNDGRSILIA